MRSSIKWIAIVSMLVTACADPSASSSPSIPESTSASADSSPSTSTATQESTASPTVAPSVPPPAAAASLPVHGSALHVGDRVLLEPGLDGSLFALIPGEDGSVLVVLDPTGAPRPGWPIVLQDALRCDLLLPVADGSVRVVCNETAKPPRDDNPSDVRAFAFDASGRPLAGWPVQLEPAWSRRCTAAVIGSELTMLEEQVEPDTQARLTIIAAGGVLRSGSPVSSGEIWCGGTWAVGPDGVAYGSIHHLGDSTSAPKTSELLAVRFNGLGAGERVAIDGITSRPAFDGAGRMFETLSLFPHPTSRVLAIDQAGASTERSSATLPIETGVVAYSDGPYECGAPRPRPPIVGRDGTIIVHSELDTAVFALDSSLEVIEGWPYRPATPLVYRVHPSEELGCGSLATPTIGPDSTLYMPLEARDDSIGGSLVASGPDGRERVGWPVRLERPGAQFWSVVVGSDGTVFALAVEPESGDESSATVLAIAADSTVRYATTIIEP